MLYVIKNNISIYDLSIKLYGTPEYAVKLIHDNDNISLTDINLFGKEVYFDESIKFSEIIKKNENIEQPIPIYKVGLNQSIYDLSIIFGFGVEHVVVFSNYIGLNGIESELNNYTIFVTKNNTNLSEYLTLQNIQLATDTTLQNIGLLTDDGDPIQDNDGFFLFVD